MKNFRRSKKALSPVVASIILIAVTVAVSIAVAAWMGALTVGFMGSSSININSVSFTGTDVVTLSLKNTGTKSVTISAVKINNAAVTVASGNMTTSDAGDVGSLVLTSAWTAGNPYKIDLYDGSGQVVGSYQATAPA
jgi:flagellin-like protein